MSRPDVRIGGGSVPFETARTFVHRYLNTPKDHWAYPAYDAYPGGPSDAITEPDLLAPSLLGNALPDIAAYDALVSKLPAINAVLGAIPLETSLAGATYDEMSLVVDIFAFLDTHTMPGVRMALFSTILHRKRPRLIPLYDKHIARCYVDLDGAPITRDDNRSFAAFAQLWLRAVQRDLDSQFDTWAEFQTLTPTDGPPISALRALNIVGWKMGSTAKPF